MLSQLLFLFIASCAYLMILMISTNWIKDFFAPMSSAEFSSEPQIFVALNNQWPKTSCPIILTLI